MKKIKILLLFLSIFLLCSCGSKKSNRVSDKAFDCGKKVLSIMEKYENADINKIEAVDRISDVLKDYGFSYNMQSNEYVFSARNKAETGYYNIAQIVSNFPSNPSNTKRQLEKLIYKQ